MLIVCLATDGVENPLNGIVGVPTTRHLGRHGTVTPLESTANETVADATASHWAPGR